MDYKMIFNIQKDLLKAVLDEKKDWYLSEGTEHITVIQPHWMAFIPKKDFYLDYKRCSEKAPELKGFTENYLRGYNIGMKIPLMYIASTTIPVINEAGKEKKMCIDVFEEDVASGKRIYIDEKLLKYLQCRYMYYDFIKIKNSDIIFIKDEKNDVIMAVMPIKLTPAQEAMVNI